LNAKAKCKSYEKKAAESKAEDGREKAQEAQERKSHFATFELFRGHSVGQMLPASWDSAVRVRQTRSGSVKVGQTCLENAEF
jgi:hypothetical protein